MGNHPSTQLEGNNLFFSQNPPSLAEGPSCHLSQAQSQGCQPQWHSCQTTSHPTEDKTNWRRVDEATRMRRRTEKDKERLQPQINPLPPYSQGTKQWRKSQRHNCQVTHCHIKCRWRRRPPGRRLRLRNVLHTGATTEMPPPLPTK